MLHSQKSQQKSTLIHGKSEKRTGTKFGESGESSENIEKESLSEKASEDSQEDSRDDDLDTESEEADTTTEEEKTETMSILPSKTSKKVGFYFRGAIRRRKNNKNRKRFLSEDLHSEAETTSLLYLPNDQTNKFEEQEGYYLTILQRLEAENKFLKEHLNWYKKVNKNLAEMFFDNHPTFEKFQEILARQNEYLSEKNEEKTQQEPLEELKMANITILYKNKKIESLEKQRTFDNMQVSKYKNLFLKTKIELQKIKLWLYKESEGQITETMTLDDTHLDQTSNHRNEFRIKETEVGELLTENTDRIKSSKREIEIQFTKIKVKYHLEIEEMKKKYDKEVDVLEGQLIEQEMAAQKYKILYENFLEKFREVKKELRILKEKT